MKGSIRNVITILTTGSNSFSPGTCIHVISKAPGSPATHKKSLAKESVFPFSPKIWRSRSARKRKKKLFPRHHLLALVVNKSCDFQVFIRAPDGLKGENTESVNSEAISFYASSAHSSIDTSARFKHSSWKNVCMITRPIQQVNLRTCHSCQTWRSSHTWWTRS